MKGIEDRGIEATVAVPVAIWNPHLTPDSVQTYDESACASGSLGLLRGADFIRTLLGR